MLSYYRQYLNNYYIIKYNLFEKVDCSNVENIAYMAVMSDNMPFVRYIAYKHVIMMNSPLYVAMKYHKDNIIDAIIAEKLYPDVRILECAHKYGYGQYVKDKGIKLEPDNWLLSMYIKDYNIKMVEELLAAGTKISILDESAILFSNEMVQVFYDYGHKFTVDSTIVVDRLDILKTIPTDRLTGYMPMAVNYGRYEIVKYLKDLIEYDKNIVTDNIDIIDLLDLNVSLETIVCAVKNNNVHSYRTFVDKVPLTDDDIKMLTIKAAKHSPGIYRILSKLV